MSPRKIGLTTSDSVPDSVVQPRPPTGAPNVIVVVLDDLGFAQLGCFGSDIATPTIDRLAAEGLRYHRFHVTALCSPTRASLLTGRDHHAVGMGFLAELGLGYPGYTGAIPKSAGTLPRILRDAGYSTLAIGKWHLTPGNEQSQAGPFDRWPLGLGFERYYGFLTAETNQWAPALVEDNHYVDPPARPEQGYHVTEDLADHAIRFVYDVVHNSPGKPFFLYFAPGAVHAPHQVRSEWSAKYAGAFDMGWDAWRARTFERQKALGVVPPSADLTERPPWVQPWAEVPDKRRRLYGRMQEVFAGFLSHTDDQIGRLFAALEAIGVVENSLVLVLSDNGASAEGGPYGTFNNQARMIEVDDGEIDPLVADWGGTAGYYHYPWAWAWAGNTPFRLWKRYSWLGGTRTPLIARWPARIPDPGAVRAQFCHVIDLMPTVLDACRLIAPQTIDGVTQLPIDGASLLPTFADRDAPSPRDTQYFEIVGSRSIVSGEWRATTDHVGRGNIWEEKLLEGSRAFDEDRWSLFDLAADFSEAHDVAAQRPDVLERLKQRWWYEAGRNSVLPLEDAMHGRVPGQVIPPLYPPLRRSIYRPGGAPVRDKVIPPLGSGARIIANVDVPPHDAEGVLCALGDPSGGFAFYVTDRLLVFAMSSLGRRIKVTAEMPPLRGQHALACILVPEGSGRTTFTLEVDGRSLTQETLDIVVPPIWQFGGTGLCLGFDRPLSVSDDYDPPFSWNGKLDSVVIEVSSEARRDLRAELRAAISAE